MKSITNFINESMSLTTLHFKSPAAAMLYKSEFEGQISDGKYENSRPYNHWEWITNTKLVYDGVAGYEGRLHRKIYSFKDFMRNALKAYNGKNISDDYAWAIRDIYYICLGKLIDKNDVNNLEANHAREVAESFGQNVDKDFDDIEIPDYYESGIKSSKYFTKSYFDKFKHEYENISEDEVKNIFASATETINTHI